MIVQVVGCSHHNTPIAFRERLAFSADQLREALAQFRRGFPEWEAVLLSTCNRVELYTASENDSPLASCRAGTFLAQCRDVDPQQLQPFLYQYEGEQAVRHLFTVAASLDSMVVGEPQIMAQVREAYEAAVEAASTGPLTHAAFQTALKVARRVASETQIQQRRVSIPRVAVADFAQQIFERFDDKKTLVIGAGEMAEETLRYLRAEGNRDVVVVNRSAQRAAELAERWHGRTASWDQLDEALAEADLVISTTGSEEPIMTAERFARIEPARGGRPLFVLDLAVPRDFDPAIGQRPAVYLYSIDDLQEACQRNRHARDREIPAAEKIIDQEVRWFMADLYHRATSPVIRRLRQGWQQLEAEELQRLFNKLPELDDHARREIRIAFDRLVNKLLHPPMESLREECRHGIPRTLVDALAKLFQLKE
ncbi:MAG TPA: glutamyl-tRNA reductase [Planctomycetaceae bacterium]|nr:glutamyl-tRNA reductase [Planctomycetaceae bacterium]HIQ22488.1 glutamyl-tRNA reductase [Planctomycetota bacterium]